MRPAGQASSDPWWAHGGRRAARPSASPKPRQGTRAWGCLGRCHDVHSSAARIGPRAAQRTRRTTVLVRSQACSTSITRAGGWTVRVGGMGGRLAVVSRGTNNEATEWVWHAPRGAAARGACLTVSAWHRGPGRAAERAVDWQELSSLLLHCVMEVWAWQMGRTAGGGGWSVGGRRRRGHNLIEGPSCRAGLAGQGPGEARLA